eukprot:7241226-Prymnesium_polylepis.2
MEAGGGKPVWGGPGETKVRERSTIARCVGSRPGAGSSVGRGGERVGMRRCEDGGVKSGWSGGDGWTRA